MQRFGTPATEVNGVMSGDVRDASSGHFIASYIHQTLLPAVPCYIVVRNADTNIHFRDTKER